MEDHSKGILVFRKYWLIVLFGILTFLGFQNVGVALGAVGYLYNILSPIIIGFCLAFILNIMMAAIENRFRVIPKKYRRGLSILATYVIAISAVIVVIVFIVPPISDSVVKIINNLPEYGRVLGDVLTNLYDRFGMENNIADQLKTFVQNTFMDITKFTLDTAYTVLGTVFQITGVAFKWLLAIFFSIYILFSKEKLKAGIIRLIKAIFPSGAASRSILIGKRVADVFRKFIGGEFVVMIAMGALCFIGMTLLGYPYSYLVSFIIAITALIPYIGGFIGPIPSIILIAFVDVKAAIGFAVFIMILNQVSANFIVPKIVGDALGLDGFWVMLAITVGGGFFGITGMVIGVPILAVLYTLTGELINSVLKKKYNPTELKELYPDRIEMPKGKHSAPNG